MADTHDLKHWYFCVNEAGFQDAYPLIHVAVCSARRHTRLRPFCIYNGTNPAHVSRLTALKHLERAAP